MEPTLVGTIFAFLLRGAILWPVERLFPSIRGQRRLRSGIKTDLAYWFFTPLVTKALTRGAFLNDPSRRVQRQPPGLQVLEAPRPGAK